MNIDEKSLGDAIRLVGDRLLQVHTCENDRGTPGTGHVPWSEVFEALADIDFAGPLVIESFTPELREIAKAVSLWRPLDAPTGRARARRRPLPARVADRGRRRLNPEERTNASSGDDRTRLRRRVHPDLPAASAGRAGRDLPPRPRRPGRGRRSVRRREALHGLPRAAQGPRHRRGPHQLADPRPRVDDPRGAGGRQARRVHGADGDEHRGLPADRRSRRADRPEVHDDGDGRLRPRVPVHQGALRHGRAGQAAVPAGQPHAGHGRLARLLARPAADVVRDALRRPDARAHRRDRRGRVLLRLGHDPRGADRALRLAVRGRDRARQVPGLRPHARASTAACSTSPASTARASTSTAPSRRSNGR